MCKNQIDCKKQSLVSNESIVAIVAIVIEVNNTDTCHLPQQLRPSDYS